MADHIHHAFTDFRDTMLTAIAKLEFQLRDSIARQTVKSVCTEPWGCMAVPGPNAFDGDSHSDSSSSISEIPTDTSAVFGPVLQEFAKRLEAIEKKFDVLPTAIPVEAVGETESMTDLLTLKPEPTSRNVLVPSVRNTPALSAAIAAANPPTLSLTTPIVQEDSVGPGQLSEDAEEEKDEENVDEGTVEEEEEDSEGFPIKQVVIQGKSYFMDSDNTVYTETEEGYEEIGMYDPALDKVVLHGQEEQEEDVGEEEQNDEEESESLEVEEFEYKGKSYYRDEANNVYDEEMTLIGEWTGSRIKRIA